MKADWGEEDVEEKEGLMRLSMGGLVVGMIATLWFTRVLGGRSCDVAEGRVALPAWWMVATRGPAREPQAVWSAVDLDRCPIPNV